MCLFCNYLRFTILRLHRSTSCKLFLPMFAVSECQSVCVRPSCGSIRRHCAKIAEQIKILFWLNTPGGPMEHCVGWGSWSPTNRGGRHTFIFWNYPRISRTPQARLEILCADGAQGALTKTTQKSATWQSGMKSCDLLLTSATPCISGTVCSACCIRFSLCQTTAASCSTSISFYRFQTLNVPISQSYCI